MQVILPKRFQSTLGLAISANRLARRPRAKTRDGRREAAPTLCFVGEGGVLLSDLRQLLSAKLRKPSKNSKELAGLVAKVELEPLYRRRDDSKQMYSDAAPEDHCFPVL